MNDRVRCISSIIKPGRAPAQLWRKLQDGFVKRQPAQKYTTAYPRPIDITGVLFKLECMCLTDVVLSHGA